MAPEEKLILVTNDDGVTSPGLKAAAAAVIELGRVMVVAPSRQWSGAGRSFPKDSSGVIEDYEMEVCGRSVEAFGVDATPAQAVLHATLELLPRRPDLVVVGVNYGENLGADVTISGTVGGALQSATLGMPALAVSLQTPPEMHDSPSAGVDFSAAIHFARLFARRLLEVSLPFDVDVLKLDVPADATPSTPWRLTRVSRQTYFHAVPPSRITRSQAGPMGYASRWDASELEPDSDIYALAVDRVVSVAPMSLDLSSRVARDEIEALLRGT
jgi:5'-nucleotidase